MCTIGQQLEPISDAISKTWSTRGWPSWNRQLALRRATSADLDLGRGYLGSVMNVHCGPALPTDLGAMVQDAWPHLGANRESNGPHDRRATRA